MKTLIKTLVFFNLLIPLLSFSQTRTDTITLKLSANPYKKTIRDKSASYFLFFDAEKFILWLTPDSIRDNSSEIESKVKIKTYLKSYYRDNDTLNISVNTDRQSSTFLTNYLFEYKNYAMSKGEVIILNTRANTIESEIHLVMTTSVIESEEKLERQRLAKVERRYYSQIFSSDYTHSFLRSIEQYFSESAK